jgi:gliding motility-associated-like protein
MKAKISPFFTLLLCLTFLPLATYAQLPPLQPEQDCVNALPVCQNVFVQPNSYQGEGVNPNEINPGPSCLGSGERNDVWYIFTVQTSGQLGFSITPVNIGNDYDWAVYNLTNNPCSDIFNVASLEVSCNYSGTPGVTGPNGLPGGQNNSLINVTAGETYVVNVSNFSGTGAGYTLDFSISTAVIFDNIPPEVIDVTADCGGDITMTFSENIVCSSVDLTDFTITDLAGNPYTILTVDGANCSAGGSFESIFQLTSTPAFTTGSYIISLVDDVVDNCGNIGVYGSDTIDIFLPNIVVNSPTDTICNGSSVALSTPQQAGFTYVWNPGAVPGASVTVSPVTSTNYVVTATAPNGCVFTGDTLITVIQTPTANFSTLPPQVCPDAPTTITYVGNSLPAATFSWNFAGGTILSGSGSGPYDVSWPTAGIKNVSLTVDQYGCSSPTIQTAVTVFQQPNSDFVGPADVCPVTTANFSYGGNASAAATYNWDFDGGFVIAGSGQGPVQVEWATPGAKNVCLIVTDNGCIATPECKTVQVNSFPVVVIPESVPQCLKNNEFAFSYAGGSTITNYDWNLGEPGALSTDAQPVYSYNTPGPKTVILSVIDDNGCTSTGVTQVTVHPQSQPDFNFLPVCFGNQTPFTDQTQTDPAGPVLLWQWDFGGQGSSPEASPDFAFDTWGTYEVSLEITTVDGCRDTAIQTVEVYEQPVANFTVESVCDNETVSFANATEYSQNQISYSWTLGDDSVNTAANPVHIYENQGQYLVSLVTTTDDGCVDAVVDTVNVWPLPVADFTADSICFGNPTGFQNLSQVDAPGELLAYRWDLSNGLSSAERDPILRLNEPNIYGVQLRVETQHGCLDSISAEVPVYPLPTPFFTVLDACESDSLQFDNLSTVVDSITGDVIASWRWDFGDGLGTGSLPGPGHLYSEDGTYRVRLTVLTDKGCESFIDRNAEAWANPAAPLVQRDTVCFSDQAFLLAPPADPNFQIEWFFGQEADQPFQTEFSYVTPPVTSTQTYYVQAVSSRGCRSPRVPVAAEVFDAVDARIIQSSELLDIPNALLSLQLAGVSSPSSVRWDFGDGQISTLPTPVHEYEFPGIYPIVLDVLTDRGCAFQLNSTVEVKQVMGIHVPTAFSPNDDGINDNFYIGSRLMRQLTIRIFNRWGKEVFSANQADFRWNGVLPNGSLAQTGVYVYQIQGVDYQGAPVKQSGSITLLR